ncbi:nuclear speckle RNA-binding protein A-like [Phoenix dactylifera]|uniref:Nuclear speckle RNA-binding protein A-like n=1 Tax=Phoenix dactylifera TaxID=42345 RepID=A0A8B9ASP0_PHODC|nr:nuclear speckle RNA-binding protein A-like [Phoenix dactylifera]
MSDRYRRYSSPERDPRADPRAGIRGSLLSDGSTVASDHMQSAGDPRGTSDSLRSDIPIRPGSYGSDHLSGAGSHATPGFSGLAAGATIRGYTPLEEPGLTRRDALGIKPGIRDVPNPLVKSDGASADQSNILFVDGLPTDCTRREVAHLFRPFIGFKDIKVVHKEPRRTGDKAHVLCFVEFNDAKCALTALEALQEYKFDARKQDSPVLRIQFAKFPFRPSSVCDDRRHGGGPN